MWFEDHTTPHSTGFFPNKEDWIKVKDMMIPLMTKFYIQKNAEKINDPKGKNPGDVFFHQSKTVP